MLNNSTRKFIPELSIFIFGLVVPSMLQIIPYVKIINNYFVAILSFSISVVLLILLVVKMKSINERIDYGIEKQLEEKKQEALKNDEFINEKITRSSLGRDLTSKVQRKYIVYLFFYASMFFLLSGIIFQNVDLTLNKLNDNLISHSDSLIIKNQACIIKRVKNIDSILYKFDSVLFKSTIVIKNDTLLLKNDK